MQNYRSKNLILTSDRHADKYKNKIQNFSEHSLAKGFCEWLHKIYRRDPPQGLVKNVLHWLRILALRKFLNKA